MDLSSIFKGWKNRLVWSDGFAAASTSYKQQHRKALQDADDPVTAELLLIQQRAKHLYFNDGIISNAVESFCQNIGVLGVSFVDAEGIEVPFWKDHWKVFCENVGYDGVSNWAMIQNIASRSIAVEGESIGRRMASVDNPSVPFQISLVPSYNLPLELFDLTNQVYNGIKFRNGKPDTYYLRPAPKDLKEIQEAIATPPYGMLQIEAHKMLHVWSKKFPEQRRGLPLLTPVILQAWLRSDLQESSVRQAVNSASFAIAAKQTDSSGVHRANPLMGLKKGDPQVSASDKADLSKTDKVDFYEGDAGQVLHGEATILQSQGIEQNIKEMLSSMHQIIATALLSASFQVDGDCTAYNYAGMRTAWTALEGKIATYRSTIAEPMLVCKVIGWYMESMQALYPNAPEAKPIIRYPLNAVANLLELMRAYELAVNNRLFPITKVYDDLGIDPSEFKSELQKTWEEVQKQKTVPINKVETV